MLPVKEKKNLNARTWNERRRIGRWQKNAGLSSDWVLGSGSRRRMPPAERLTGKRESVGGW